MLKTSMLKYTFYVIVHAEFFQIFWNNLFQIKIWNSQQYM